MSFDLALIDGDISIRSNGSVRTVEETPKLRQDILKAILTPLGSNRFHPWYGCSVGESVIGRNFPENIIELEAQTSITQTLERIRQLQQAQLGFQEVTLGEQISSIGPISVNRNPVDTRQLNIRVAVTTRRLTQVDEIFQLIS